MTFRSKSGRLAGAILLTALYGVLYADQVDDIVKSEMAQQHIPGLALAAMKDGRVVRSSGYGLANVELNVPVTPRTVFKIGSISKQFIASGVMILVQEANCGWTTASRNFSRMRPHPGTASRCAIFSATRAAWCGRARRSSPSRRSPTF